MKKIVSLFTVLFFFAAILITGCKKEENIFLNDNISDKANPQSHEGLIQLGKKLENPYTVNNMQKAYQNLSNDKLRSANVTKSDISVTHLYVRFLPKTFEELEILKQDTSLTLFDFPLDYEIEKGGTYYQDPELPDTAITWQYCSVKKDYSFPDIEYEVLAELFLPEYMEDSINLKSYNTWTFWDDLETEALRITGNLDESVNDLKSTEGWIRNSFNPSGKIQITDDCGLGTIGLEGVKVIARSWFTTKSDYTDSTGYFYINYKFKGHCNYWIKWERGDFDIRSENWGQAYFNGPRSTGAWNLIISKGGMSWVYGHIHRGAYTYYYKNIWGIKSPPKKNKFLTQRIHFGAMDKIGRAHYYDFNKFWLSPQIKVYKKARTKNGVVYEVSSEELFGTTVHELAHASHWEIGYTYGQYVVDAIFSEPFLPESWALGVESEITSDIYHDSYEKNQDQEISKILGNGGYTPIVIDLIDDFNQRAHKHGNTIYPIDRVKGYTLKQLENALYNAYTWNSWEQKIESSYSNSSKIYLKELFGNYKKVN